MLPTIDPTFPPFRIVKVSPGTIVYPPSSQFGPRIQQDVQLFLLDSGSLRLWIDDTCHTLLPGKMILLQPGHREKFEFSKEEETWHRWLTIGVDSWSIEIREFLAQLPFTIPITQEMSRMVNQLILFKHRSSPEYEKVIQSLGISALYLYAAEAKNVDLVEAEHPAIFLAKSLAHRRFSEELTLVDLAKAGNITQEHLIRLFQRHLGITPMHYLWQYRTKQGVDLLINTGLTVTEIAYQCGFKTSNHFARTIKKWTNRTPTDIRHDHWQAKDIHFKQQ